MTRKIIVSIVSEQTLPNVLFIKETNYADKYYFITTRKMEKKHTTSNILKSLNLNNDLSKQIEVVEDSLLDIDHKLVEEIELDDDDEILVNITGGTKIMSLGVYNFFSRNGAAKIFYIPLGKNEMRQIFPLKKNRQTIIEQRTTLLEYLYAYGVEVRESSFDSKNTLLKTENETNKVFKSFTSENRDLLFSAAEEIRLKGFRGKKIRRDKIEEESVFKNTLLFRDVGLSMENDSFFTQKETKYLTGEWFEEFIYPRVKSLLQKKDDEIGLGVQLVKEDAPNEYDIIFTHNNSLYVIECKTDIADNEEGKINYLFANTLYKAATLKKEFGLWVNYYLFALNDFSQLKQEQKDRAKLLDIKLVGLEILTDEKKLKEYILKM